MSCLARARDLPEPGPETELKFGVRGLPLTRFLRAVDGHVALEVFDPLRPVQYTRSTYLDTMDLLYFRSGSEPSTLARPHPPRGPRVRLRIREYAAGRTGADVPLLTGLCFLELKESEGRRRTKVRWRAPAGLVRALVASGGQLAGGAWAPPEILARLRADRPGPVATTWYRRRALVGDGVRITLDDEIAFAGPVPPGAPGQPAAPAGAVAAAPLGDLLEVKHVGPAPAWLAAALTLLPAPASTSKFELAMATLGGQPARR